jgi:hypothetical protein
MLMTVDRGDFMESCDVTAVSIVTDLIGSKNTGGGGWREAAVPTLFFTALLG